MCVSAPIRSELTLESLEPPTLKGCLKLVRSTAEVIRRIHDHGWLYLDIKPENIFVLEGTHEIVQLFDFDSLVPMDIASRSGAEEDYRISHTRGFSAVEQQRGDIRRLRPAQRCLWHRRFVVLSVVWPHARRDGQPAGCGL